MKLSAKIFSNVNLKLLSIVTKGSILDAWMGVQNVYQQVDITQFLNFNRDISLASKDDIILIIPLHLKFRSVNFLSITQPFKQLSAGVKRIFVWKIFLQVIIKASVVEFILTFHTFSISLWTHLGGCVWSIKDYSLRGIFF